MLDGFAAPTEGDPVAGARLDNVVWRCLREVAWLELTALPKLLIRFGYDMRMLVASSVLLVGPLDEIWSSGLFVYDREAAPPTLDAWSI